MFASRPRPRLSCAFVFEQVSFALGFHESSLLLYFFWASTAKARGRACVLHARWQHVVDQLDRVVQDVDQLFAGLVAEMEQYVVGGVGLIPRWQRIHDGMVVSLCLLCFLNRQPSASEADAFVQRSEELRYDMEATLWPQDGYRTFDNFIPLRVWPSPVEMRSQSAGQCFGHCGGLIVCYFEALCRTMCRFMLLREWWLGPWFFNLARNFRVLGEIRGHQFIRPLKLVVGLVEDPLASNADDSAYLTVAEAAALDLAVLLRVGADANRDASTPVFEVWPEHFVRLHGSGFAGCRVLRGDGHLRLRRVNSFNHYVVVVLRVEEVVDQVACLPPILSIHM